MDTHGDRIRDRIALSLEPDCLHLTPQSSGKAASARDLIGCSGYHGPAVTLKQMDPALYSQSPEA